MNSASVVQTGVQRIAVVDGRAPSSDAYAGVQAEATFGAELSRLWRILQTRRRLFWFVTLLVTSAVLAKTTILETPIYQGGFQLLIDDAGTQFKAETPGKNDEKDDAAVNEQDFETLITLMRSPIVLEKVARRLEEQGQPISVLELQGAVASSKLSINRLNESGTVSFTFEDASPVRIEAILDAFADVLKDYSLERNRDRVKTSIEFLNSQFPGLQASVQRYERRLQQFREANDFIDPENLVATVAAEVNANRQQLKEIQFQLNQAQANKRLLERQLAVKADNAIAIAALSESSRYQTLLNDLLEIDKKIALESARLQPDSPIFTALKSRRQEVQQLLKVESSKLLGVNRTTRQRSQLTSTGLALNQRLIENANQVRVLSEQQQYLTTQARTLSQRSRQVPLLTRQYQALKRELDVAESNLTNFLEAREKYRLQLAQSAVPWEVISPPQVGLIPIFPKIPQSFALSISLGILAGMGAAIYRDRSDNVFRSIQQVQVELTGVPVIATVPHLTKLALPSEPEENLGLEDTDTAIEDAKSPSDSAALGYYWQDPTLEYFRGLVTRLDFFSPDRPLQAIAVASSVPNEGKSTVSLQMAQAAATLGKRVLLIDADLRQPKLHERVGIENTVGLSNLLTSQATIHEVLQVVSSDLSILTAGTVQADPARLLGSNRMQELVTSLRNSGLFDLIIFDTPPLLGITDTSILSKHNLDGLLLVLGLGYTDRDAVRSVVEQLQVGSTPLLGVVANVPRGDVRVDTSTPGSSHYRYYRQEEPMPENRLQQLKSRARKIWSQL